MTKIKQWSLQMNMMKYVHYVNFISASNYVT